MNLTPWVHIRTLLVHQCKISGENGNCWVDRIWNGTDIYEVFMRNFCISQNSLREKNWQHAVPNGKAPYFWGTASFEEETRAKITQKRFDPFNTNVICCRNWRCLSNFGGVSHKRRCLTEWYAQQHLLAFAYFRTIFRDGKNHYKMSSNKIIVKKLFYAAGFAARTFRTWRKLVDHQSPQKWPWSRSKHEKWAGETSYG